MQLPTYLGGGVGGGGNYLNLGLGTYCGFPPVGWVHIGYLFLMVFILVTTEATSDVGTKY